MRDRGMLEIPSLSTWQVIVFTFKWMFRFELVMTLRMFAEILLIAASSIAQPLLLSYIFDIYIPEKDYAKCTYAVVGVVMVMLTKAQMNFRLGNDNPSGGDFVPLMTKNLTRKAIRLPWTTLQSMHSDFLVNTLNLDMTSANLNLDLVMSGLAAAVDFVAVLFTMMLFSPALALCIILALPGVVYYNKVMASELADWSEKLNETQKRNEALTQEIVTHVQHIKLLGIGPVLWRKLMVISDSLKVCFDMYDEKHTGNIRGLALLSMVTTVITIAFGTVQVILDQLSMGKLLGFLQLAQDVDGPIEDMTTALLGISASRVAVNHIVGLLEAEEEGPGSNPPTGGVLVVKNVHYDYKAFGFTRSMGPYDLEVKQGQTVAIVGASGCGKSTMLKLLSGLLKPKANGGMVTLDGVDLAHYDTTRLIAWMEQESVLLSGTLRDNLVAGSRRAIPEQALMHACDLCRFDYAGLAQGLDTHLGQNGSNLSVGDRQRIAAARTVLLRRPLVVCDEPTSAQDPATSGPVISALLNCEWDPVPGGPPEKSTMLAVTHNIDIAKRFETICVVSQASVVEMGSTDKLLALNGHFAQMVRNLTGITVLPSGLAVITAERLMDLWIFSRVPEARLLTDFTTIFLSKALRAGEEAALTGTPADAAFVVARGSLAVLDKTGNAIRTWDEGEVVGGINLHGTVERQWGFTVLATRPTVMLVLQRSSLKEALESGPREVLEAVQEVQAAMASAVHPTSLRRIWAFATLPEQSMQHLITRMEVECYPKQKRLFHHPKDPPKSTYVVVSGSVSVRFEHPVFGEYVQQVSSRSVFGESVAFSDGQEGTPFYGKCPLTNKGSPLSCITAAPTIMLVMNRHLLCAGEEELEKVVFPVPIAVSTLKRLNRSIGVSRIHTAAPPALPMAADSVKETKDQNSGGGDETEKTFSKNQKLINVATKMNDAARRSKLSNLMESGEASKNMFRVLSAAKYSMKRVEEKALVAAQELHLMPSRHIAHLVKCAKETATAEFFSRDWILSALPHSVLENIAKDATIAPVEEGQELAGSYGWGVDAAVIVSGHVAVTYVDDDGQESIVQVTRGRAVNVEALLNDVREEHAVAAEAQRIAKAERAARRADEKAARAAKKKNKGGGVVNGGSEMKSVRSLELLKTASGVSRESDGTTSGNESAAASDGNGADFSEDDNVDDDDDDDGYMRMLPRRKTLNRDGSAPPEVRAPIRVEVISGGCVVLRVTRKLFIEATKGAKARRALDLAREYCLKMEEWLHDDGLKRAGLLAHTSTSATAEQRKKSSAAATSSSSASVSGVQDEKKVIQALIASSRILVARPGEVIDPTTRASDDERGGGGYDDESHIISVGGTEGEDDDERNEEGGWHEALPQYPAGTYMVLHGEGSVMPWTLPEENRRIDAIAETGEDDDQPGTPTSPGGGGGGHTSPKSSLKKAAQPSSPSSPTKKKNSQFSSIRPTKRNSNDDRKSKREGEALGAVAREPTLQKIVVVHPTKHVKAGDIFTLMNLPDSSSATVKNTGSEETKAAARSFRGRGVDGGGPKKEFGGGGGGGGGTAGSALILLAVPVLGAGDPNLAALVRWRDEYVATTAQTLEAHDSMKKQVRKVKQDSAQAELAMGLRHKRTPRANWRLAWRRYTSILALGDKGDTMVLSEGADAGACTLYEQLDMEHSLLGEINKSIKPREERLEMLLKRWDAGTEMPFSPLLEPEKGKEEMDSEWVGTVALGPGAGADLEDRGVPADPASGDLSLGRLDALEDRIFAREAQRSRRLKSFAVTLRRLCAVPELETERRTTKLLTEALEAIEAAVSHADAEVNERKYRMDASAAIPQKVLVESRDLYRVLKIRIEVRERHKVSAEMKRSEQLSAAYEKAVAGAKKARRKLEAHTKQVIKDIVALQVELMVKRDGREDPLYQGNEVRGVPPGALHVSNYNGRTERHLAALNAEESRLDGIARLTRATVERERKAREAEVGALMASKERALEECTERVRRENIEEVARLARENEENERRLYAKMLEDKKRLEAEAAASWAKGAKHASHIDQWRTGPFVRTVMEKWRFTLAIKRHLDGLVDEISTEIAAEAIPAAESEARDEIREAMNALFGGSDGGSEHDSDDDIGDYDYIPGPSFKKLHPSFKLEGEDDDEDEDDDDEEENEQEDEEEEEDEEDNSSSSISDVSTPSSTSSSEASRSVVVSDVSTPSDVSDVSTPTDSDSDSVGGGSGGQLAPLPPAPPTASSSSSSALRSPRKPVPSPRGRSVTMQPQPTRPGLSPRDPPGASPRVSGGSSGQGPTRALSVKEIKAKLEDADLFK